MLEFDVGGRTYVAGKIELFTQFNIVRRLIPAAGGLIGAIVEARVEATEEDPDERDLKAAIAKFNILRAIGPFTEAIAAMPDADAAFILENCLAGVKVKVEGDRGWANAFSGRLPMDDSIDLMAMMQIAYRAAEANLGGFFGALATLLPAAETLRDLKPKSSRAAKTGS